ncbi:MAG: hypothetical protein LBC18_05305 [Opitutaceae bacterium]|nr:hypothetical protein [Opitutaceae bacterium]
MPDGAQSAPQNAPSQSGGSILLPSGRRDACPAWVAALTNPKSQNPKSQGTAARCAITWEGKRDACPTFQSGRRDACPAWRAARLALFVRWTLGLLLLWAGLAKLADPAAFYVNLLAYRLPLLRPGVLRFAAAVFPWLELSAGAGLLLNRWADAIHPLAIALTALFALALGQALLRGLDVACGCFGRPLFPWTATPGFAFGRALFLLAGALFLHFFSTGKPAKGQNQSQNQGHAGQAPPLPTTPATRSHTRAPGPGRGGRR